MTDKGSLEVAGPLLGVLLELDQSTGMRGGPVKRCPDAVFLVGGKNWKSNCH